MTPQVSTDELSVGGPFRATALKPFGPILDAFVFRYTDLYSECTSFATRFFLGARRGLAATSFYRSRG